MLKLLQKECRILTNKVNYSYYVHFKDHNKKINPESTRLKLSYMRPTGVEGLPHEQKFQTKLKLKDQLALEKKIFEEYKHKLLQGVIDKEEQAEVDPLWGEGSIPIHYYKNLGSQDVNLVSYSILNDIKDELHAAVSGYFEERATIKSIEEVKDANDLCRLATFYRLNEEIDRQKWYEIEQSFGNKFYKLSKESLVLLKWAFNGNPRFGTPNFHRIVNDLLQAELPNLNCEEIMMAFHGNRFVRSSKTNLHRKIYKQIDKFYKDLDLQKKLNWLIVYIEGRLPFLTKSSHRKYLNEDREQATQLLYKLQIDPQSLTTFEQHKKLTYFLVRAGSIKTNYYSESILQFCMNNVESFSSTQALFFLTYLPKLEGGEGVFDQKLYTQLHEKVSADWQTLATIHKVRVLHGLWKMGMWNEEIQEIYNNVDIQTDGTILGYFCELEMANSSGREWEVLHKTAELEHIPLKYFQQYKRFHNYMKSITDWNLKPITDKLANTQPFFDAGRFEIKNLDKIVYRNMHSFISFSGLKFPLHHGRPVQNLQFVDFSFPEHRVSVDIITSLDKIPNTNTIKPQYEMKIRSLEAIGWKHIYLQEQDVMTTQLQSVIYQLQQIEQEHKQEQQQKIQEENAYRMEELEYERTQAPWTMMTPDEVEGWMNDPEGMERKSKLTEEEALVDGEEPIQFEKGKEAQQNKSNMEEYLELVRSVELNEI